MMWFSSGAAGELLFWSLMNRQGYGKKNELWHAAGDPANAREFAPHAAAVRDSRAGHQKGENIFPQP
jgi:hypothetical protein